MKNIIIYIVFAVVTQVLTYKLLRRIDKKERKFLKVWEQDYINAYKDLWREAYFEKLAEEKKIKEYEEQQKKEKAELKKRLSKVHADDEFKEQYGESLQQAIEELEEKEIEV